MATRNLFSAYAQLWLRWVLASASGWALGWVVGYLLSAALGSIVNLNDEELLAFVVLPTIGIALGTLQWLVLRHHLPRAGLWIAANLLGYLGVLVVVRSANTLLLAAEGLLDDAVLFFLMGAAVGTPQWLILRRHYPKSFSWVLVSSLWWMGFLVFVANPASSIEEFLGFSMIIGGISGAATGLLLIWFMKARRSALGYPLNQS